MYLFLHTCIVIDLYYIYDICEAMFVASIAFSMLLVAAFVVHAVVMIAVVIVVFVALFVVDLCRYCQ